MVRRMEEVRRGQGKEGGIGEEGTRYGGDMVGGWKR